jgi:hypothetical protein
VKVLIVQNYVVQSLQTCGADKLEQEEKCDGRNCFVLYNIFKFFLRRSGILSILSLRIGPSVLNLIDCIQLSIIVFELSVHVLCMRLRRGTQVIPTLVRGK